MKKIFILLIIIMSFTASGTSQTIFAFRSKSELNRPDLKWYMTGAKAPEAFMLYRSPAGKNTFTEINTFKSISTGRDTVYLTVTDTTLTEKGLWEYYIEVKDVKGARIVSEIMYGHNMGAIPSPQLSSFKITPSTSQKALILKWKLNYNFTVKALVLFRSRHYNDGFEPIATLPATAETYVDKVEISGEPYFYFFQIRDFFGYQVPSVVVHGIATFSESSYPPQNFKAETTGRSVKLSWERLGETTIGFRIYRQTDANEPFSALGEILPPSINNYTDTALNQEGKKSVRYYAVSVSDGYQESNSTDTVEVPLPWNITVLPPETLDGVADSTGIRLFWSLEGLSSDVLGFNIYRTGEKNPVKINNTLIPFPLNTYLDLAPGNAGALRYEIESVSVGGRPSVARTITVVENRIIQYHVVLTAELSGATMQLSWINPAIPGIQTFYIYRQEGSDDPQMVTMISPASQNWTDTGIKTGSTYIYTMVAELKNGSRIMVNEGVLITVQ